jgi:hypothetical protein
MLGRLALFSFYLDWLVLRLLVFFHTLYHVSFDLKLHSVDSVKCLSFSSFATYYRRCYEENKGLPANFKGPRHPLLGSVSVVSEHDFQG